MIIEAEIEHAIARSQSHNEIVRVEVLNLSDAIAAIASIAAEIDTATEWDGSVDVWGTDGDCEFRLRLSLSLAN